MRLFIFSFTLMIYSILSSQNPINGVNDYDPTIYALKHAKIFVSADRVVEDGVLIIQGNKILNVGPSLMTLIPKGAIEIDCSGQEIYPSFVEIHSNYGVSKPPISKKSYYQQLASLKGDQYYWNQAMNTEVESVSFYNSNFKEKKDLIHNGFGTINTHSRDGISRGSGHVFLLDSENESDVVKTQSSMFYSFKKGTSKQSYPSSQMGCIALLRQYYYDLEWYQNQKGPKGNLTLNAELDKKDLPKIFEVDNKLEALRVAKLGDELGLDFIIKSGGDEYENIDLISETNLKFILPLNFTKPLDVRDPFDSRFVTLEELKEWEEGPSNPYFLYQKGVDFCFTSDGIKLKDYLKNIRKTIKRGLPLEIAVQKMTSTPASYLGIDDFIGTLEKGKIANFIVTDPNFFKSEKAQILQNWISGKKHVFKKRLDAELTGTYDLNLNGKIYVVDFKKKGEAYSASLTYTNLVKDSTGLEKKDTVTSKSKVVYSGTKVSFMFEIHDGHFEGNVACNGSFYKNLGLAEGNARYNSEDWFKWSLIREKKGKEKVETPEFNIDTLAFDSIIRFPNMAYGYDSLPGAKTYFIKNATIWTNEENHVLKNANLLIQDGKIKFLGNETVGLPINVEMIDAKGKYVTCGIVDEHSHIGISRGVNESGQNNSAEVTIEDVVNPEDINIYRQLSGGVTTAQLLHGSANPIGGRSALIKLKWGFSAKDYLIPNAAGFIKFALGENVKQSNSSGRSSVRYPQTRLGVEQVYFDAFIRAQNYMKLWDDYNQLPKKKQIAENKPRYDLELEVMAQILRKERFVTCHSYIQSEINMLMHVADTFQFNINTFTHILEGYKLADKMKAHGVGGSTFADWWAYKYEVKDAIPYNAAMMNNQGVVVAINSDDAEMGRRLNHEAAKTIKYGAMTEQEAWKMVTLNPAKLLHLDDRIGSIKVGKDADIVIWSDNPLSVNAKVETVFIDGIKHYDLELDKALKKRNSQDRARIISSMIQSSKGEKDLKKPTRKRRIHYHCNTLEE